MDLKLNDELIKDVFKTIEGLTKEEFSIFVEKNKEDFGEGQDIISITIAPEDFAKYGEDNPLLSFNVALKHPQTPVWASEEAFLKNIEELVAKKLVLFEKNKEKDKDR